MGFSSCMEYCSMNRHKYTHVFMLLFEWRNRSIAALWTNTVTINLPVVSSPSLVVVLHEMTMRRLLVVHFLTLHHSASARGSEGEEPHPTTVTQTFWDLSAMWGGGRGYVVENSRRIIRNGWSVKSWHLLRVEDDVHKDFMHHFILAARLRLSRSLLQCEIGC